ncbi:MAG: glycosyltransferase [Candidatus Cloacimonetes bacterium]|nr:glycosyltransferase [Candidatus Cloacimonadota bacterium]
MKKMLLITYYFPPAGGPAVQRWLRFLKYLPAHDWQITVITTEKGDYPFIDESLLAEVPLNVKLIRTKTPTFGSLFHLFTGGKEKSIPYGSLNSNQSDAIGKKMLYWARLNLVVPDARMIWNKHALRAAEQELNSDNYDVIVTTGPPHSTHLVGLKLKKQFNIPWVTDFRDPWSKIFYMQLAKHSSMITVANERLETKVLAEADLNLVVSKQISEQLPEGRKEILPNGFDADKFEKIPYHISTHFRIKFIGSITQGQTLEPFIRALEEFVKTQGVDDVELELTGDYENRPYLAEFINYKPFTPHKNALDKMRNAELLLLPINTYTGSSGMLTTKLFEYIGSGTPILCFGPSEGAAAQVLRDYGTGITCSYTNHAVMLNYLEKLYTAWHEGTPIRNSKDTTPLHSSSQTAILDKFLREVLKD